jgi:hypothetical protein
MTDLSARDPTAADAAKTSGSSPPDASRAERDAPATTGRSLTDNANAFIHDALINPHMFTRPPKHCSMVSLSNAAARIRDDMANVRPDLWRQLAEHREKTDHATIKAAVAKVFRDIAPPFGLTKTADDFVSDILYRLNARTRRDAPIAGHNSNAALAADIGAAVAAYDAAEAAREAAGATFDEAEAACDKAEATRAAAVAAWHEADATKDEKAKTLGRKLLVAKRLHKSQKAFSAFLATIPNGPAIRRAQELIAFATGKSNPVQRKAANAAANKRLRDKVKREKAKPVEPVVEVEHVEHVEHEVEPVEAHEAHEVEPVEAHEVKHVEPVDILSLPGLAAALIRLRDADAALQAIPAPEFNPRTAAWRNYLEAREEPKELRKEATEALCELLRGPA